MITIDIKNKHLKTVLDLNKMTTTYFLLRALVFSMLSLCSLFSIALAEPLRVNVIPWVQGQPDIPHLTVRGSLTSLQAIAEDGECDGQYLYRWDWNGDGDFADTNEGFREADANNYGGFFAPLPLDIVLPDHEGDFLYFPKVEVRCGEEVARQPMPILSVEEQLCGDYLGGANTPNCQEGERLEFTRSAHAALAIDRAMWAMFLSFEHNSGDGHGHEDVHLCSLPASKPLYALGHSLTVFNRRGHGHGLGRDQDPYYRHVTECGLNTLLSVMELVNIPFDDEDVIGRPGQALQFVANNGFNAQYWFSYESTAWIEPIALFGDQTYVAQAGRDGVFGRNLRSLSQDLADALVNCMGDDFAWSYVCANGVGQSDDASSNGWAPEALRLLERTYAIETYDVARLGQRSWLSIHCPNGICPYHGGGPKLSGNALVGYGWADEEVFNEQGESGDAWRQLSAWYTSGQFWGLYFIYSAVKGLRSFTPELDELSNGLLFSRSLIDFFITGEDSQHSDASARQNLNGTWDWNGDWVWGGSISTMERTAIITQLLQTWLEVFPYARSFPREVGPGESVTFDHSWSHSLNAEVNIERYLWDVATYNDPADPVCEVGESGCQDLNNDGDCADIGERCNEDLNGDGVVSGDEIFWEFETVDPELTYSHTYLESLTWGEVLSHPVTLQIIDSNGRIVEDHTSVEVTVSLSNHPPIIISHPDGAEAFYTGHIDTFITFDGRTSYDPDRARDPYPGDNNRPAGIRDSVTTIDFDLNRDGDFNDLGEAGLDRQVRTIFPEDVQLGDVVTVPIRVCDDGQWSDRCFDGIEEADCSRCSYGQAFVELIPNLSAPVIDTCREGLDCEEGYTALDAGVQVSEVQLDLSETYDPDGDLGLIYTYEVVEGEGVFVSSGDFSEDMGATPIYRPIGEGVRTDRIRVTVTDSDGLSSEAIFEVHLPNIIPNASWGDFDIQLNPPLIIRAEGRNEWSGRFRVVVDARVIHGAGVVARPILTDAGDSYRVYLDYDDDGVADQEMTDAELAQGATPYQLDDGYGSNVNVWCVDDDGAESNTATLRIDVPTKDESLIYRFDVGADGSFEEAGTFNNFYEFFENDPNIPSIPIAIEVEDQLGATASTVVEVSLLNRPPTFIQTSQIEEGYSVTFVTSATDPDLDRLTYSFNSGNATPGQVNESGVFVASYPAVQASYLATVTVSDGRGGEAIHEFEVSFLPPVDLPPVIDLFNATATPGGEAEAIVESYDPEGQPVVVTLDWGDGGDLARVVGGRASRRLAYRQAPYLLSAQVTDPSGQEDRALFSLQLIDAPTEISSAQQSLLSTGERLFTIIARDLDSPQLEYYWDYNGDGLWDDEGTAPNVATHLYPSADAYTARIGVKDPWSGVITETTIEVPSTEPLPPRIIDVTVQISVAGETRAVIEAIDPEGERLDYELYWGDTLDELATIAPLGIGVHQYDLRPEPYVLKARVVDGDGLSDEREVLVQIIDAPTLVEGRGIWVEGTSDYLLEITATDQDSPRLTYYWDLDNDGQWDEMDQVDRSKRHRFNHQGPYEIRVGARDPWSGAIAETSFVLQANQPPEITDLRLSFAPRGEVTLEIDAFDPEGTTLSYQVFWGDIAVNDGEDFPYESLSRDRGTHSYDYSASAYRGVVKVTDAVGLSAQADLLVPIDDHPTEIREVNITRLNGGEVELRINATDLDSPRDLRYSFDFGSIGRWSPENQIEAEARFTFEQAGEYPIILSVLDPWSGLSVEAEMTLSLSPWLEEAINEDHVIGDEGSCVVFRVEGEGRVASKVDPTICDRTPESSELDQLWLWRFGDGDAREGLEVGHRYRDDGVYLVELQNRDLLAPQRSTIQAYISNVPPHFTSEPPVEIVAGERFEYLVTADDLGITDELKLSLIGTYPEGMVIEPVEESPRSWRLLWQTPTRTQRTEISIELRLIDGHQRADNEGDLSWVADGGEARQSFILALSPTPFDPFANGEFAGTGHGPQGCEQRSSEAGGGLLLILVLIALSRRRHRILSAYIGVAAMMLCLLAPTVHSTAEAQDLQLFTPAAGDWNYITVNGGQLIPEGKWAISSAVSYGNRPLIRVDSDGKVREVIVNYVSALELSGVIGLFDWLEIGLHVPYLYSSGLSQPFPVDDANGVGDLRLSTKFGLYRPQASSGLSVALNTVNHIPGGDGARQSTRRHYSVGAQLNAEYRQPKWRIALNGGYRHLSTHRELTSLDGSSMSVWGLGGGYSISQKLELITEAYQRLMTLDRSPFEALFALRIRPHQSRPDDVSVTLGSGFGLGTDLGSVGFRLFAALTYRPSDEPRELKCTAQATTISQVDITADSDGDGVSDRFDRCPKVAEDRDGFEDVDGCPDIDNDQDGIEDKADRCPLQAETVNNHQDQDGCPDQLRTAQSVPVTDDDHAAEGQLLDITERVFFKHNESILLSKSYPIVNQVANLLIRYPQIKELRVEGHTDDTGAKRSNIELSQDRAAAVLRYLVSKGVEASRLVSRGYGDTRPIASNDTDEGRALNRRVNFRITRGPQEIFVIAKSSSADKAAELKRSSEQKQQELSPSTKEIVALKEEKEPVTSTEDEKTPSSSIARYSVQVKASIRLKDAEQVSAQLDQLRLKNYTLSHRGPDKRLIHRVRLGPYQTRALAEEAMGRFKDRFSKGQGAFIVKVSTREAKNALK